MRKLVALLAICGSALAAVVLPAAAQTAPPPTMTRLFPACGDIGDNGEFSAGGTSQTRVTVELFEPSGTRVEGPVTVAPDGGFWGASLRFNPTQVGEYEVRATNGSGRASGFIQVPCRAPTLEFQPSCFPVGYSGRVTLIGRNFRPFEADHLAEYDPGGAEAQTDRAVTADNHGVVRAFFSVRPSNRPHPGRISDANRGLIASGTWPACPPGTTTTSSSTTAPTTTVTSTPPDDSVPDAPTTTTRPPEDIPGTPVTVPPTIDLPPPTPGATLTVSPELGPAGFVTGAVGTGFPAGAVTLTWAPGIGTTTAIVGPDGTFTARVLVFPNDRIGPRALIAAAGATTSYDAFLVVPSSVQPSGQDVQQITRIRRFNQR